MSRFFIIKKYFFFSIYNDGLVSDVQQSDSVMYMYTYIPSF